MAQSGLGAGCLGCAAVIGEQVIGSGAVRCIPGWDKALGLKGLELVPGKDKAMHWLCWLGLSGSMFVLPSLLLLKGSALVAGSLAQVTVLSA